MIKAKCLRCGNVNETANLENAPKVCQRPGCERAIGMERWVTENGMPANKALWDITCRDCGTVFKGEYWKNRCVTCFAKRKGNYSVRDN